MLRALVYLGCPTLILLSAFGCSPKSTDFFIPGATSPNTGGLGAVSGTVRVNGTGVSGQPVTLVQAPQNIIGTATTGAGGTYTITNVPPGAYTVALLSPPAGTVCSAAQPITVQANQTATADFTCTTAIIEFVINLAEPPPGYRHIGPGSSETCTGITTNPPQSGATWSTVWSGPGTVGSTNHSGTLNKSGNVIDRQAINQIGNYNVTATVRMGSVTKTATGTVNVQSAQGTCLAP